MNRFVCRKGRRRGKIGKERKMEKLNGKERIVIERESKGKVGRKERDVKGIGKKDS